MFGLDLVSNIKGSDQIAPNQDAFHVKSVVLLRSWTIVANQLLALNVGMIENLGRVLAGTVNGFNPVSTPFTVSNRFCSQFSVRYIRVCGGVTYVPG